MIRHVHLIREEEEEGQPSSGSGSIHTHHRIAAKILDRVNFIERSNALVLIHMGESFTHQKTFAHELRVTMDWLNTIVQRTQVRNKVVWLTSWPQHYPNSIQGNGYFHGSTGGGGNKNSGHGHGYGYSCVPRTNITNDWRNTMLLSMLAEPIYNHMDVFDDRALIGPLSDMHKGGGDCTHLCYSPILHQLLWDSISKYVEHYESLDP